jgi:hypothetical protein
MSEITQLTGRVKEVIVHNCSVRVREEADGVVLEFRPLPAATIKRGVCAIKTDIFGNFLRCYDAGSCSAGCRTCTDADGEYFCSCGKPCPPVTHPKTRPRRAAKKAAKKKSAARRRR